jgi:hypothetical protein
MLAATMIVLPLVSIVVQMAHGHHDALNVGIVLRWFVFWAVGVRLLMAGVRQMIQPSYTAATILGIKDPDATIVVRELGFANAAIGGIGMSTLLFSGWVLPMAMVGAIFYGLAGINHLGQKQRNKLQNMAMTSDLFAALVLLGLGLRILMS